MASEARDPDVTERKIQNALGRMEMRRIGDKFERVSRRKWLFGWMVYALLLWLMVWVVSKAG